MPRQDVPYGGAICRLKERLAEIWDKLGEKLHSVNGVMGDAAGNVEIVSGDAAITISDSQVGHYIEIGLDHSALPNAAVSSVNGETGAVVLDGNDIGAGLPGGLTVADELGSNRQQLQTVGSLMQQEVLDRQNADSALQTNINQVQAGIPAAAAAAVAADPTVAQLIQDLNGKIDLSDVSTVETPDTIAKRNSNGRLVAADPASGATDKTLVTANWISQTGDSAPNNLIHKTGTETIPGSKKYTSPNGIIIDVNNKGFNLINFISDVAIGEIPASIERHGFVVYDRNNQIKARLWIDIEPNAGAYNIILRLDGTIYNPNTQQNEYRSAIVARLQA